ncbi:MAG: GGDEF domain-containing response regulator [Thiotrichales bacterium]|nr:GGDEF domain-containing response regulator [Thiotrichales bacterium]
MLTNTTTEIVPVGKAKIIRVLHIADDRFDAHFISEAIAGHHCHITHSKTLANAIKRLNRYEHNVVLLNLNLPDSQGLNTIDALHEHFPELAIVVLSSNNEEDSALEAVRLGAQNYIPKNVADAAHILRTLHYAIDRKEYELNLISLAFHDPVSNLASRNLFFNNLQQSMRRCDRTKERMALMFLDIDHFKEINDQYGHDTGDHVLRECAQRLSKCVRKQDLVSRLGGDEFTVILENIKDCHNANRITKKIINSLSQSIEINGLQVNISASIGISFYDGQVEIPAATLIKQTDIAMYQAKKAGRNTYKYFMRNLKEINSPGDNISALLNHALEHNEFHLHYQPQIDAETHELVGAEALLRWNNKELGSVLPSVFIPLLEDSGHIVEIGEWVLKTACQNWASWVKEGKINTNTTISVNLSALQFTQEDIAKTIAKILSKTGLQASQLDLELTESTLLSNTERNLHTLKKIKNLGVSLTIDDFGTGFSSLPYLKHFCFDRLKVDRSYINHVLDNSVDAAISSSIINLAKNLDLKVIAEGVDSWDKVSRVKSYGCTIMQGFYYSRPLAANTFLERYACSAIVH